MKRILSDNINSLYYKENSLNKSFEQRFDVDYQLFELFSNSLYRALHAPYLMRSSQFTIHNSSFISQKDGNTQF